jgi:hypothetical protein
MGSRTMPMDCEHGVTVDWGDFGPCQDCAEHNWDDNCPNIVECPDCADDLARLQRQVDAERAVIAAARQVHAKAYDTDEHFAACVALNAAVECLIAAGGSSEETP